MKISPHFDTSEFLVSASYPELAKRMVITDDNKRFLWPLVWCGLQPCRDYFGMTVIVTSGKRSVTLNAKVGGWIGSQHLSAAAADIWIPGMETSEIWDFFKHVLCWGGQLILYPKSNFVHVGLPQPGVPKRQFISQEG